MQDYSSVQRPHRRFDPLSGEWVLNSPHRLQRPWLGEEAPVPQREPASHDPQCYLCPGNRRAGGASNPDYDRTYVFDNDYPALLPEAGQAVRDGSPLFRSEPASGTARVICYSPDHSRALAELDDEERLSVVQTFCDQTADLGRSWNHVQLFENKGEMMGCSNPHPHAQVWASAHVPEMVVAEDRNQREWQARGQRDLLGEAIDEEIERSDRVVRANGQWAVVVPFWARWPFETLIVPRKRFARFSDLDATAQEGLAAILGALLPAYDRLFGMSFPYSMGWHGAPFVEGETAHWRLHAHVYPPLLRSATVRKFMVGYEMLAEPQRDFTPEVAAARLRECL